MGLLSFLKRKSGDSPARPVGPPESTDSVQQARIRARQRLVGAVVLVAAGVIGFPLLFETQPRPLPGDTPIEIARRAGSAPAPAPARTTPAHRAPAVIAPPPVITETPAEAGREVAAASAVTAAPEPKPEPKPAEPKPAPEAKPAPKPEAKPAAESIRAQALLEGKPAASKPAAAADGRFIVQVGAFAEVTAAREARQKVEKLGTCPQDLHPGGRDVERQAHPRARGAVCLA
jgi:DedD protein